MSDFSGNDYDFAVGSVLGMRSWRMDEDGRLRGVTHRAVWLPGENVAACRAVRRETCPEVAKRRAKLEAERPTVAYDGAGLAELRTTVFADMGHHEPCGAPGCYRGTHPGSAAHIFDADCECGFWAYDEHTFQGHGDVIGIIEGYGKTTIGTRGFRCEKARIVALCRETEDSTMSLSAWLRLQQLYPAAKFYDEIDDMVTALGGVLRAWSDASAEGFWDDNSQAEDEMMSSFTSSFLGPHLTAYVNQMLAANPAMPIMRRHGSKP